MIEGRITRMLSIENDIRSFLIEILGYEYEEAHNFVRNLKQGTWRLCEMTIKKAFVFIAENVSCPLDDFRHYIEFFDIILEFNEEMILEDFLKLRQFSDFDSIYESIQNRCELGRNVIFLKKILIELRINRVGDL